jgi:tRNA pseudouridine38-40 synthase
MVRIIAGTLLKVGSGQFAPEDMEGIIQGRDRSLAGPTAPAKGLTLIEIRYPNYQKY